CSKVPFQFQCPAWNPIRETKGQATIRILAEARKALKQHLEQVHNLMRAFDVSTAPVRLSPEHFDWLVLYQVGGRPFRQIARDFGKRDAQTVANGVKDAA